MESIVRPFSEFVSYWCRQSRVSFEDVTGKVSGVIELQPQNVTIKSLRSMFAVSRLPRVVNAESEWLASLRDGVNEAKPVAILSSFSLKDLFRHSI